MPDGLVEADVIAISGHRDGYARSELFRGLDGLRAKEYVFGGARGVDTEALEYMGRTQPGAVRTVIVPNEVRHQPAEAQAAIRAWANEVMELRNAGPDRYHIRNMAMIDRSDRLEAFYDFRGHGGTRNAIEYARSVGKDFGVTPVQPLDLGGFTARSEADVWEYAQQLQDAHVQRYNAKAILLAMLSMLGLKPSAQMLGLFRSWRW